MKKLILAKEVEPNVWVKKSKWKLSGYEKFCIVFFGLLIIWFIIRIMVK